MNIQWQQWGENVVKALNAHTERLNEHTVMLPGLQADVAVLIDAVLRKDAEADAMRAWIAELENRLEQLEVLNYQTVTYTRSPSFVAPSPWFVTGATAGRIVVNTTTDGTGNGTTKL